MKKILWPSLVIALTLSFVSCDKDNGPTMNEDYAGVWYLAEKDSGDYYKSGQTDSSYDFYSWNGSEYEPLQKGILEKVADGEITSQMTEYYFRHGIFDKSLDPADEGWYDKEEMIAFSIDEKSFWSDAAAMEAELVNDGSGFDKIYGYYYVLSADESTLTLTNVDVSDDVQEYV